MILPSMRIEFALNSHSLQCEFNAHCACSNEQLERSDSMWIKGVAIICHVIRTCWRTAWKWRPFSDFVSAWVHPPDILPELRCPSWLFSVTSWCWVWYGKELYHMTFASLPTHFNCYSLWIHFQSTSRCGLNECAFNAHRANAHPMGLHVNANEANSMRIQCALEVSCEWALKNMMCGHFQVCKWGLLRMLIHRIFLDDVFHVFKLTASMKELLQWSEPTHCLSSGFTQHHCLGLLGKRNYKPPSRFRKWWCRKWLNTERSLDVRVLLAMGFSSTFQNWWRMSCPVSSDTWCDIITLDPLPRVLHVPARTQPNSVSMAAGESWLPLCRPWHTTSMKISTPSRTSTLLGLPNSVSASCRLFKWSHLWV